MMMLSDVSIWIAVIAALVGCYFATCAIALRTFSRSRLAEMLDSRGQPERLTPFIERVRELQLVSASLRAITSMIVLLAALHFFQSEFEAWSLHWQYFAAFLLAGTLVSVFIVAVPVSWAHYQTEPLLVRSMVLLRIVLGVLWPIVRVLHAFDPIVRRISGADIDHDDEDAVSDEVMSVVEDHESTGKVDPAQKQMIEAVFDFPTTTAEEIMTPRTEIDGIEVAATLEQIKAHVAEHGHSRIPVYEDNLDHIAGILYAKDLIPFIDTPDVKSFALRDVMREAMMVPESKSVHELLAEFRANQVHIAILLDEYGGTAGLVTIEDIIEELVGEIQDEYEPPEEDTELVAVDEQTFDVDARMHVDDFNDQLDVELPEDEDYDTLGGFVVATLGHIPEVGEFVEFESLRLTVTEAERTRVSRLKVERIESDAAAPGTHGK
jgi:CBS domain containing-hemolysin-like protein